jgi:nucleoside-triphosphatase THEP1
MELASACFRAAVERLLDEPAPLVASVQASRHPFTEGLKRRPDVELIRLSARNRDSLPHQLVERIRDG